MPRMAKGDLKLAVDELRNALAVKKRTQELIALSSVPEDKRTPTWEADRNELQSKLERMCAKEIDPRVFNLGKILSNMSEHGGVFALHPEPKNHEK